MAIDYIKRKHESDKLHHKIKMLQDELIVVGDNALYYKEQLKKTRLQMISVHSMVNAKSNMPNTETVDAAWDRCMEEIKKELKGYK